MTTFTILELRTGRAESYGPKGESSAINKRPTDRSLLATAEGLEGDEQGDRRHHGGLDKALHAYAVAHYEAWARELPGAADRFAPGAFGENLVVDGVTEHDLCLGDQFQMGKALVELSQSRQPCWKLNLRFNRSDMARRVQATGRTGWYFRVLNPGVIAAGAEAHLIARPNAEWPLTRVWRLLYHEVLDREALGAFLRVQELPDRWRRLAERRLASGQVEDWNSRTDTPRHKD
jgi:MOSC domain-containing protein YiiM